MAAPLFSEPRGSPTGGESVTAAPCVGGGAAYGVRVRFAVRHGGVGGCHETWRCPGPVN